MALVDDFLAFVEIERNPQPSPALAVRLDGLITRARTAWPTFDLPTPAFLKQIAQSLAPDLDLLDALDAIQAEDLYLALGCAQGNPKALAAFETTFMSQVGLYLSRQSPAPGFAEDVQQILRTRLLVGEPNAQPRIATYSGRGPLGAWLRSITVRVAIDLRRLRNPADPGVRPDLVFRASAPDPEMHFLRTKYAAEFRQAFEQTLTALSTREGNVLRLYFLEGMSAEDIGLLYKVSARTVQRWLTTTREKILEHTHRNLRQKLSLSQEEFGALLSMVESQVDVSILRFLKKED